MRFKIIICLFLISLTLVGCTFNTSNMPSKIEKYENEEDSTIEKPVIEEPLIEENMHIESIYSLETIIEEIHNLVGDYKDNISLYYYNLDTEEEYFFNEDVYYVSASLKKLPLVMQVLDKIAAEELALDTKIEYNVETDYMNGTGILQFQEYIGEREVSELLELSILESDNIAYNMLNRLCEYTLVDYIRKVTEDEFIPNGEYTKLTAKHNFKILYRLYTNPDNNPYYTKIIEIMKKTAFHDRLDKYVPHHKVAHKIGSYFRYYHDGGIVFAREKYILVVMSKDIGVLSDDPQFSEDEEERMVVDWGEEACELIGKISKSIYDIIETGTISTEELIKYKPEIDEKEITNEAYGTLKEFKIN